MASYTGNSSVTATLTASTVDTVTLLNLYTNVTVVNESSAGVITFSVDGTVPTAGGNDFFEVAPNSSVTVRIFPRLQGESSAVNGVAGPTWTNAADGTPVPSQWVTTLSGAKFSRGVDTNNVLSNPAVNAFPSAPFVKLISGGTPSYTVIGNQ